MGNLFSKASDYARYKAATEFIVRVELRAAAQAGYYPSLDEAREAIFQEMKKDYGFETDRSYKELVRKVTKVNDDTKAHTSLLNEDQIKWLKENGFGETSN